MKKLIAIAVLAPTLLLSGCISSIDENESSQSLSILQQDLNGNLISGGYLAEHDGFLYFANQDDMNKLYRMDDDGENKIKLSDQINTSYNLQIQFEEDKLFYLQSSGINQEPFYTLYSYDLIQNVEKKISDKNICSYAFQQNFIYFTTMEPQEDKQNNTIYYSSKLFKMRLDGSDIKLMDGDYFDLAFVQTANNQLYIGHHESVVKNSLECVPEKTWYAIPHLFVAYKEDLFYVPYYTTKLYRTSINTEVEGTQVIDKDIAFFTVSQDEIYFSTFDKKIYKSDLEGNNLKFIVDGTAPILLSEFLFYLNPEDKMEKIDKKIIS